jgi:hypothetical protein
MLHMQWRSASLFVIVRFCQVHLGVRVYKALENFDCLCFEFVIREYV